MNDWSDQIKAIKMNKSSGCRKRKVISGIFSNNKSTIMETFLQFTLKF